jgi:hypothetical protein
MLSMSLVATFLHCQESGVAFTSEEGDFSAVFPGPVSQIEEPIDTPDGPVVARMAVHMQPMTPVRQYIVSSNALPTAVLESGGPAERLLRGREGLLRRYPGQIEAEESIASGRHPGRSFEIRTRSGQRIVARLYEIDGRLYVVSALTPDEPEETRRARKFVESFEYLGKG